MTNRPSPSKEKRKIEAALKERRKAQGLSQEDVARVVGTSKSNISSIENGRRDYYFSTFLKVCKALGVDVDEIVKVVRES